MGKEGGGSHSNMTSFEIPAITHFEGNVKNILERLLVLRSRVIKLSKLEDPNEEVKLTFRILGLI